MALITGAASGIGLAAAKKFARAGLHICLADADADGLAAAEACVAKIIPKENVLSVVTDVSKLSQVEKLRDEAMAKFGEVGFARARRQSFAGIRALYAPSLPD